jgi:predicted lysophospholipase L1 biosynthesis ABC-type transport system permease subunit
MIGAFLLLPFYMTTFLIKILPTVRKLWGNTSYVAVKNLIPQVKKNTFIMLTIGSLIILAMLGSTLLKTVKFNGDEYLKAQYPTNIVISARETTSNALNHSAVIEEIKKIQGVTFASRLLNGSGSVSIKQHDKDFGFAYALADLNEMIDQGLIQGSTGPISQSDDVYVTKRFADKYHLHIGEIFEIGLYSDEAQATLPAGTRTVAGIMPTLPGGYADVYMDWQTSGLVNGPGSLQKIFVSADRDSEQLYQELTQLKKQFPALQVNTYEKALQENEMMFVQRWAIFIIVNLVILCSVIIGIMSVLANYIYSKRKEFAIIRTFFVTPYGVLKMIITQVFLYLLVGILTGIVIGLIVTRSIFLIDTAAAIHFDFGLPVLMILLLITISLAVFLPYGIYMSKRNLADELLQE